MNAALRTELRITYGKESEPSTAILYSQFVKTTETPGIRGAMMPPRKLKEGSAIFWWIQ